MPFIETGRQTNRKANNTEKSCYSLYSSIVDSYNTKIILDASWHIHAYKIQPWWQECGPISDKEDKGI